MSEQAITEAREIAEWDWVYGPAGGLLHAPLKWNEDPEDWVLCDPKGTTLCGLTESFAVPGIFSRMQCPRCEKCCELAGIPSGIGSPKNDDRCRPTIEARIAVLRQLVSGGAVAKVTQ